MAWKIKATFFILLIFMSVSLPPIYACTPCTQPHPPPYHRPQYPGNPKIKHPPKHGGAPKVMPPKPPVFVPPITNPPVTIPPPSSPYPPYTGGGGGSTPAPPSTQPTCPVNALKLGLCVDVLGGLVHVGLGNPVENACCPVLGGLLQLEAAVCLCTALRLKLLNLNIFIPLALQVLITCGINPPPGFICPPL
ncbi:hypothetical protein GQ457_17G021050 [Hibiscus cannabinus]